MKKRKLWVSIIAGLLALIMVLGIVASAIPTRVSAAESSESIRQRLEALEEERDEIDAQIEELDSDIDANYTEIEGIVAQKNQVDQEIFLLIQQITNTNNQIVEYSLLVADKQDELDIAQEHLEQLQADSKERIRAMEKNGKISYWSVLFQANSFTDLLDRLEMIEQIAEADEERIEELCVAAEAVETAKSALEAEVAELEANKAEMDAMQVTLEEKRAESDALLQDLVDRGIEFEALMEEAEEKLESIEADIDEAQDDYEDAKRREWLAANPGYGSSSTGSTTPSTSAPSSAGWINPCRYTAFTSAFGWRIHPIYGTRKHHNGVDLAGPTGTPIYASRSGTVSGASYDGSRGYYVIINHGDGFKSHYYHLTHYIVYGGQSVSQGQVIGYMGSTGASTGPHLHFGVSYNGSYVNPANYINI